MQYKKNKNYNFKTSYMPFSTREIEIEFKNNKLFYNIDNYNHIIDVDNEIFLRSNNEIEMVFNFQDKTGYLHLVAKDYKLPFEIDDYDLKYNNEILHLDFTYILEDKISVEISIA
ncbi:MAG: hypothetical protein ACK5NF_04975 [Bacilli bacterium]